MDHWIEEFRETIDQASNRLGLVSEEQSSIPRAPGKWSPKEIIGHLIDSASNNHQRFVRAQFTDELVFPGYEQVEWVSAQRYSERPWSDLISLWRQYNLHLVHVMSAVPVEIRKKPRTRHNLHQLAWKAVPESEPVTLEYFMRDYVGHLRNHLDQILK
jgi:hypothetical protein